MTEQAVTNSGQDTFSELAEIALKQKETAVPDNGQVKAELAAFEHKPRPIELVSGWHFREWKQRHVMALWESGTLAQDFDNRWRRNFEVVKAAIECDCFDKPTGVTPDVLLDMDTADVEMLHNAVSNNFTNIIYTPKN